MHIASTILRLVSNLTALDSVSFLTTDKYRFSCLLVSNKECTSTFLGFQSNQTEDQLQSNTSPSKVIVFCLEVTFNASRVVIENKRPLLIR